MIEKKVRELIEGEVNKLGIILDKVEYVKEGNTYFLRIVIDRDQIIDVDTCVEVTKAINPLLDNFNIISDSYILDVCSKERGGNDGQ